ncbi:MAG: P-loop NTPase [Firmicutes bacterium]|nr:P-loop NTPase [Bacillota bacterium]
MIIAVASGKGGTGKTTIATNLALTLAENLPVQVLDCDTEEPNAHLFLKPTFETTEEVQIKIPVVNEARCLKCGRCTEVCAFHAIAVMGKRVLTFPELCHGCGGCLLACPTGAIKEAPKKIGVVELGYAGTIKFAHGKLAVGTPLASPVVKAVREKAERQRVVIIDAPPGTSCSVVNSVSGADYCLLVTEPTPFGLNDLVLAVGMVRKLGLPFGVIINRSDQGDRRIEEYCRAEKIPILLKIPFNRRLAALYARGGCIVEEYPEWKETFRDLWQRLQREVGYERAISN